jgi:hypothetical protein
MLERIEREVKVKLGMIAGEPVAQPAEVEEAA